MIGFMQSKMSIVIPCYNEAESLPFIYKRIIELVDNRSDLEFILVNNGSKDSSKTVFQKMQTKFACSHIRVVEVVENKGYGFGVLSGLKSATGSILAWTHADLQTEINDVLIAFESYKNSRVVDIFVKGKRRNRRMSEAFFTFGMQIITFFALGVYLDDINAQPKLFTRSFYTDYLLDNPPLDFSLDLFALYQANKYCEIVEVPVSFKKRQFGEAKGGGGDVRTRIKLINRTFKYIFEFRRRIGR